MFIISAVITTTTNDKYLFISKKSEKKLTEYEIDEIIKNTYKSDYLFRNIDEKRVAISVNHIVAIKVSQEEI